MTNRGAQVGRECDAQQRAATRTHNSPVNWNAMLSKEPLRERIIPLSTGMRCSAKSRYANA
ncbi:MAG: hypothetical protein F6K26_07040 [Moorea sp. SIO2I5]|nr:hypothetical protein [Moorena sp. SIO2I5]